MKTTRASSGHRPPEIDETSSPTTVYVRENITETTQQLEDGSSIPWWEYSERQYDRREYNELQIAQYVLDLEFRLILLETQGGII